MNGNSNDTADVQLSAFFARGAYLMLVIFATGMIAPICLAVIIESEDSVAQISAWFMVFLVTLIDVQFAFKAVRFWLRKKYGHLPKKKYKQGKVHMPVSFERYYNLIPKKPRSNLVAYRRH